MPNSKSFISNSESLISLKYLSNALRIIPWSLIWFYSWLILLRKQVGKCCILIISGGDDDRQLNVKLMALIKNKLCKLKEVPQKNAIQLDTLLEGLSKIHQCARKAVDGTFVALYSQLSLLFVRIIAYAYPLETEVSLFI